MIVRPANLWAAAWLPLVLILLVVSGAVWLPAPSAFKRPASAVDQHNAGRLSPYLTQGGQDLDKGKFLVAGRELRDPNFRESVVLLLEYGEQGTLGLIINRPLDLPLSSVLKDIEGLDRRTDSVYFGGPVAGNQLLLLLRSGRQSRNVHQIIDGLHVSADLNVLKSLIEEGKEDFRVYAGSAGWAPGQLEAEMARGDWHILPANPLHVFSKEPSSIWSELIRRSEIQVARR